MTPEEAAAVEDKLFVVPPFQALTGAEPKTALSENQPIILGFVGRNFFHKGGEAVLRAVERSGESLNMRALIVSRAANNDFLTDCVTEGHITEVRERLSSNPRISWYQGLPNREVMVKLATATVGALPTMADTYGYSNLEAMSLGLPIIGTNVQAGSEIVAPDVGWRLDLELRKDGFWAHCGHLTRDVYCDTVDYLAAGIEDAAQQLRELPDILPHLSEGALRRVHDVYNSERAEKMLTILLKTL
jgi:glycosyltransferase involved in cell wall biosynthesis